MIYDLIKSHIAENFIRYNNDLSNIGARKSGQSILNIPAKIVTMSNKFGEPMNAKKSRQR